jgi:hypothetical protein
MDQRNKRDRKTNPGSVYVGFLVDKVGLGLGQVFPRVLRFSPVNFILLVLHYLEKLKKLFTFLFITGLHNKHTQGSKFIGCNCLP